MSTNTVVHHLGSSMDGQTDGQTDGQNAHTYSNDEGYNSVHLGCTMTTHFKMADLQVFRSRHGEPSSILQSIVDALDIAKWVHLITEPTTVQQEQCRVSGRD